MEVVKHHDCVRERLLAAGDERRRQVHAYELGPLRIEATEGRLDEADEALLALPFGDMYDPSSFDVVEEGDVAMTLSHGELVDG